MQILFKMVGCIKPRALHILGKYFTTEPPHKFFKNVNDAMLQILFCECLILQNLIYCTNTFLADTGVLWYIFIMIYILYFEHEYSVINIIRFLDFLGTHAYVMYLSGMENLSIHFPYPGICLSSSLFMWLLLNVSFLKALIPVSLGSLEYL